MQESDESDQYAHYIYIPSTKRLIHPRQNRHPLVHAPMSSKGNYKGKKVTVIDVI